MKDLTVRMAGERHAEVLVYGEIGDEWDGITAKQFAEEVRPLKADQIDVHIASVGGSAWDAIAMMQTLKQHPARVDTYVDSIALSAASLLMLAGERRSIAESGSVMIHEAWMGFMSQVIGGADDFRAEAEAIHKQLLDAADRAEKINNDAARKYSERTNLTTDQAREAMRVETWYDADEAVELGFATEISTDLPAVAAKWSRGISKMQFRNVPDRVKSQPRSTLEIKSGLDSMAARLR